MGFCYLPPERVKMGCCCLHPDRVKLTVNSKKETSSRVKMGQGSRWAFVIYPLKEPNWAKGQDGLLLFTPWHSRTDSEQQGKTNHRVKVGHGPRILWLKSAVNKLGQKKSTWAWPILTLSQIGPRSQDGSEHPHARVTFAVTKNFFLVWLK